MPNQGGLIRKEAQPLKMKETAYWVTTAILVLGVLPGGIADLARVQDNVEGIAHLGYPVYFLTIIGFWKVLGSIALLVPRFPRLKEWAYAGIFFNMTGAAVSRIVCQDAIWPVIVILSFAALAVASWALRPPSRTLGVPLPSGRAGLWGWWRSAGS
jgi:hypothetical protein